MLLLALAGGGGEEESAPDAAADDISAGKVTFKSKKPQFKSALDIENNLARLYKYVRMAELCSDVK